LWTAEYLTGDWGGVRTQLDDLGIVVELKGNTQMMVNMRGGRETKNGHDSAASYNLEFLLDFEKMELLDGASFFFEAKGTSGGELNDFDREKVGALSKTNADAKREEPIFVDKWWWAQRLFEDRVELRLGRIESEKDLFDVNAVAGHEDKQFMNKALVRNPTISHRLGLGVFTRVEPTDWLYVQGAVIDSEGRPRRTGFDTAFHGPARASAFWEFGLTPAFDTPKGDLPGHYMFGSWYDPLPNEVFFDTRDGQREQRWRGDDVGFYFGFDQLLWKENEDPLDRQGVTVFGRYGYAHDDVNLIEHFWSAGAQYAGLIPTRDDDVLGIAMAQSILSDRYRAQINPKADRETVYELYYAIRVTPWFIVSPDFQYLTNAGGHKDDPYAMVAGLRLRIIF
jgi:porin